MTPFQQTELDLMPREKFIKMMMGEGLTKKNAKAQWRLLKQDEIFINDLYQVNRCKVAHGFGDVEMIHLSIKRLDKEPCHDWRHLQQIKTELVGPECEAIEIYPAESRIIDAANQYHLWVFDKPGYQIPVGFFDGRHVGNAEDAEKIGAKQRPLEETS